MARIVVIDDDRNIRDIMCRVLEREKHEVFEAENGLDGFKVASQIHAELVITDLAMPEESGIDLITKIKRIGMKVPILAVTGEGKPVTAGLDLARRHGATGVLGKPFTPAMLRAAVECILKDASTEDATGTETNTDSGVYFIMPPDLIREKLSRNEAATNSITETEG